MERKRLTVLLSVGIIFVTILAFILYTNIPRPPSGNDGSKPPEPLEGKIFFLSDRDGGWDIYVMNSDGTNQTKFFGLSWASILGFDISPDGKQLVFVAPGCGEIDGWKEDIYLIEISISEMKVIGQPIKIVDNPARDYNPEWSPDGKQIAFQSTRSGDTKIYLLNNDGEIIELTKYGGSNPDWSPDGKQIIFNSANTAYGATFGDIILVINANGSGKAHKITNGPNDQNPAWSPDGLKIAFECTVRYGEYRAIEIFIVNVDGSGRKQITFEDPANPYNFSNPSWWGIGHGNPVWLPNGQILCEFYNNGQIQIMLMNSDGSNQKILTSKGNNCLPVWVPATSPTAQNNTQQP